MKKTPVSSPRVQVQEDRKWGVTSGYIRRAEAQESRGRYRCAELASVFTGWLGREAQVDTAGPPVCCPCLLRPTSWNCRSVSPSTVPLLGSGTLLPATSPFWKNHPSDSDDEWPIVTRVCMWVTPSVIPLTLAQFLPGHSQARRQVFHVQWLCKGSIRLIVILTPTHTHTVP